MRHRLWIIFPTTLKIQGRATLILLSVPSCHMRHHIGYESLVSTFLPLTLGSMMLELGFCTPPFSSAISLLLSPINRRHYRETGRREEERGTWSFCLFVATTSVTPGMSLQPLSAVCSSPQLFHQLAHPELLSSSHISST